MPFRWSRKGARCQKVRECGPLVQTYRQLYRRRKGSVSTLHFTFLAHAYMFDNEGVGGGGGRVQMLIELDSRAREDGTYGTHHFLLIASITERRIKNIGGADNVSGRRYVESK